MDHTSILELNATLSEQNLFSYFDKDDVYLGMTFNNPIDELSLFREN